LCAYRPDGLSLDVGAFVAALEYASRRESFVVGKPARGFIQTILDDIPMEPGHAAMVGDDVESDVGGALRAGLAGILVRTGKYREDAVRAAGIEPTAIVDSIADVPALDRRVNRSNAATCSSLPLPTGTDSARETPQPPD
jgi:ribonucleotide monophosphatase NagD (HAD superfamily)